MLGHLKLAVQTTNSKNFQVKLNSNCTSVDFIVVTPHNHEHTMNFIPHSHQKLSCLKSGVST